MIGIDEECRLQVGIGKADDIVNATTPFALTIRECIGNRLPEAIMTIGLDPSEVLSYLTTEHTNVNINIGYHEDTTSFSQWQIVSFKMTDSDITFLLTIDRKYITDIAYKVYDDQSCNVIKTIAEEYFEIKDAEGKSTIKLTSTGDKMKWTQHGSSMRDFVDEVWLHSWADNKLMMPVISAFTLKDLGKGGLFKLIDITDRNNPIDVHRKAVTKKETVKEQGVWLLSSSGYNGNPGDYNTSIGNRKYSAFDIKEAKVDTETIEPKPIFKGDFNAIDVKTYNDHIHSISDNVHKNYAKARASNLSRLSKFTDTKRIVVVDYGEISIGDMVNVTVPVHNRTEPNDLISGCYLVTEVKQTITSKGIVKAYLKELTLRRDANIVKDFIKL